MSRDGREAEPPAAGPVTPELPRPFPTARIGAGAEFVVEAKPAECEALSKRMGVSAIHSLVCRFNLKRAEADAVEAHGLLQARVRQSCVVTLEPFDADVVESFSVRFVPEGRQSDELNLEADDEVTYTGGVLDLGEAASEQLALALDPFPRIPGAELPAGGQAAEESAFADLGKLLPRH